MHKLSVTGCTTRPGSCGVYPNPSIVASVCALGEGKALLTKCHLVFLYGLQHEAMFNAVIRPKSSDDQCRCSWHTDKASNDSTNCNITQVPCHLSSAKYATCCLPVCTVNTVRAASLVANISSLILHLAQRENLSP